MTNATAFLGKSMDIGNGATLQMVVWNDGQWHATAAVYQEVEYGGHVYAGSLAGVADSKVEAMRLALYFRYQLRDLFQS